MMFTFFVLDLFLQVLFKKSIWQFHFTWLISQQFTRRYLKPVAFLVIYLTNELYLFNKLFVYSTIIYLIIIYTFSESEIFFPILKIQALQFFQKNILFRRPKILLSKVFIVWYPNRTNFFKMDFRNVFLTIYLIFAKVFSCLNYIELWLNFLWHPFFETGTR